MASDEVEDVYEEDEDMIDLGAPFTLAKVEIGLASSMHNPAFNEETGPTSLYNAPRPIEYNPLPREDHRTVYRLTQSITAAWGIMSAATPFPGHLLPDPDPYNWGIPLLRAILNLAQMTGRQYPLEATREEAVHWICQSIEDTNRGKFALRRGGDTVLC
ncbi:hypothetical protein BKA63DRAFT_92858 [Paraphoma chrysanthemicola]|nr:hypothetical protein BKA63DRAFT_92858 [Paraphoma chrysanthemicola]